MCNRINLSEETHSIYSLKNGSGICYSDPNNFFGVSAVVLDNKPCRIPGFHFYRLIFMPALSYSSPISANLDSNK